MVTVIIRNAWPLLEDSSRPRDGTAEPVPLCSIASVDPTPPWPNQNLRKTLVSLPKPGGSFSAPCAAVCLQAHKAGVESQASPAAQVLWQEDGDGRGTRHVSVTTGELESGSKNKGETETVGHKAGRRTCLWGGSPRLAPPGMASSPEPREGRGQMPPAGALQPSHPLCQMGSQGSER